jgi:type IV pilus assembly protein PilM
MAFSISNIFKDLFSKKNPSVLGIDIGTSSIKVVQLKRKHGQAAIETYGEIALGPYGGKDIGQATNLPSEKIAEALRDLLKEANVTTKTAGIAIPFVSSLVSLIEMPMVDSKQLAQMVPIEARKYIPVPISEVLLDWSVVPKAGKPLEFEDTENAPAKSEKTDIMVVAIHNDTITKYQEISAKTGVEANFYEIEMFSTIRSVLDQSVNSAMIVDVGAGSTKLYIVEGGVIRNSHLVNRGSQDITSALSKSLSIPLVEAEEMKRATNISSPGTDKNIASIVTLTLDYIFSESNQVLLNYEKKYNKTVNQVILIGGGVLLQGFLDIAKKNFQVEVVLGEPFAKVEAPAFLENVLKSANPEFSVAVGLALRMLQDVE